MMSKVFLRSRSQNTKKVKIMLKIVVWFLTLQAIYRGKLQFVAEKKKKEWQNATSIAILMKS